MKPFSRSKDIPSSLEVQEFTSNKPDVANPFTNYVNNFYVYPVSLNYSNQKIFSKVRLHPSSYFITLQVNYVHSSSHKIECEVISRILSCKLEVSFDVLFLMRTSSMWLSSLLGMPNGNKRWYSSKLWYSSSWF